jgi:transcriptional regulator with XRE-family HTH domain
MLVLDDDPADIAIGVADRVRTRRLEADMTQQGLARRAGLPLSTYRRFESTGEISLRGLVLVAVALGTTADFATLFEQPRYASIDEILDDKRRARRRGHRND